VTLGTVYMFFNYMAMLEAPLDQITQQLQEFQKAAAGLRRVREMLDAKQEIVAARRFLASNTGGGHLRERGLRSSSMRSGSPMSPAPGRAEGREFRARTRRDSRRTRPNRQRQNNPDPAALRLYDPAEGRVLLDASTCETSSSTGCVSTLGSSHRTSVVPRIGPRQPYVL